MIETFFPDAKQEITVPLRDVEIGEQMARYVQDSNTHLAVGQVESDHPSQVVRHDLATCSSRPCSETSRQTVSIGRTDLHEREPVSSGAFPWRHLIGQPHPVVETQALPAGRFGNAPRVSGSRHIGECLRALLLCALALALVPSAGFAEEPTSKDELTSPAATQAAPIGPPAPEEAKDSPSWEMRPGRSYLIPALEIPAYGFLLNLFDRHYTEPIDEYRTTGSTIHTHLTDSRWVLDRDQFSVNQFMHPYGGTVYFGFARSAGLNFWESFLYAGAGSFLWEIAGEKTLPSINDQITTTFGGTFLEIGRAHV